MDAIYPHLADAAYLSLHRAVVLPLVAQTRLDRRLYQASLSSDLLHRGKLTIRMRV
jgi:hypothetical protein